MTTGDTRSMLTQQIRICRDDNLSDEQSADNIMHFFDVKRHQLVTYSQVDKALRERENIETITSIRVRNNDMWMRLLAIALESAPDATKAVLRQINENDRKVSDLLGDLAK